jgi:hypothetical protein
MHEIKKGKLLNLQDFTGSKKAHTELFGYRHITQKKKKKKGPIPCAA